MKKKTKKNLFSMQESQKNPKPKAMTHMQRTCKVKKKSVNQSNKKP